LPVRRLPVLIFKIRALRKKKEGQFHKKGGDAEDCRGRHLTPVEECMVVSRERDKEEEGKSA